MTGGANKNWVQMTDAAIVKQIGVFIKKTRLKLNKTQEQVAEDAGLNRWTISKIENGESITLSSLIQILRALDVFYVLDMFKIEDEISPLAYAKLKKEERERASGANKTSNKQDDLGW